MATFIIGTIVIGWILYTVINLIKKVKRGESSCGAGCSGCSSAGG